MRYYFSQSLKSIVLYFSLIAVALQAAAVSTLAAFSSEKVPESPRLTQASHSSRREYYWPEGHERDYQNLPEERIPQKHPTPTQQYSSSLDASKQEKVFTLVDHPQKLTQDLLHYFSSHHTSNAQLLFPWLDNNYATGTWGGLRSKLLEQGIDIGFLSMNETWGNTTGGMKTGSVNLGLQQLATHFDTEKLLGWSGGSIYSCWSYLYGNDPSAGLVDNFLTISAISGYSTLRNTELWIQQELFGKKLSLRAGQLVADSEFAVSDYSSFFLNNTFEWPAFIYTSIPNQGPNNPVGAPGVRLELKPTKDFSWKLAVYQSNVYPGDVNNHGFYWNLNQGLLYLSEGTYQYNHRLPGHAKIGTWLDSGTFTQLNGSNASAWGNYGVYEVVDQMIWNQPRLKEKQTSSISFTDEGLSAFESVAFQPSDRNLLSLYCDAGFHYKGLLPTRNEDVAGIAMAYAPLSSALISAQQGSNDYNANNNIAQPIEATGLGYEIVFETTYMAQLTPWLTVQPDLQYILHPGGAQSLGNALVLGVRTTIVF